MSSDRDRKKAYIPWHERVDETLIRELASQFVQTVYRHGLRLSQLNVEWKDGDFELNCVGSATQSRNKPKPGETVH